MTPSSLEVVFPADYKVYDGRYANNAWLQELPDPITKLTWDNAIQVGPKMAERLHLAAKDVVELELNGKKVKGAVSQKTMDEIDRSQFEARAVEPHSTARGFLFFDVSDISNPLNGANFYITEVRDSKGNELMYFEIPLEKYLSAPQNATEEKKP